MLAYKDRLARADHIVFIFPIWWELMPALIKGFIDAHTHLLADGSPDYGQMLYRQSTAARAIAATAAARRALEYGFTTSSSRCSST